MARFVWLGVLVMVTGGCGEEGGGGPRVEDILALTGDATAGEALYSGECALCHAADGTGGTGPNLVAEIAGEDELGEVVAVILNGDGDMPSFADWTDQEIADVLAYMVETF